MQAIRSDAVDDVHFAIRFASLLETHIQVLRRRFVPISNPLSTDISRTPSAMAMAPPASQVQSSNHRANGVNGNMYARTDVDAGNGELVEESRGVNGMASGSFGPVSYNWQALLFQDSITEPFEREVMENILGSNAQDSFDLFWNWLP
jgi:hypothetical protein